MMHGIDMILYLGAARGWLMGTFMLIGIPLYGITMSVWGQWWANFVMEQHDEDQLSKPILEEEFLYCCQLLSEEGSTSLNMGEFILLELMRSKQVDVATIQLLKSIFIKYDEALPPKKGQLDLNDMISLKAVVPQVYFFLYVHLS